MSYGRCSRTELSAGDDSGGLREVRYDSEEAVTTLAWGKKKSANEPGSRRLITDAPGARTSTERLPVPQLENGRTVSSFVDCVPLVSTAPTDRTKGSKAGLRRA